MQQFGKKAGSGRWGESVPTRAWIGGCAAAVVLIGFVGAIFVFPDQIGRLIFGGPSTVQQPTNNSRPKPLATAQPSRPEGLDRGPSDNVSNEVVNPSECAQGIEGKYFPPGLVKKDSDKFIVIADATKNLDALLRLPVGQREREIIPDCVRLIAPDVYNFLTKRGAATSTELSAWLQRSIVPDGILKWLPNGSLKIVHKISATGQPAGGGSQPPPKAPEDPVLAITKSLNALLEQNENTLNIILSRLDDLHVQGSAPPPRDWFFIAAVWALGVIALSTVCLAMVQVFPSLNLLTAFKDHIDRWVGEIVNAVRAASAATESQLQAIAAMERRISVALDSVRTGFQESHQELADRVQNGPNNHGGADGGVAVSRHPRLPEGCSGDDALADYATLIGSADPSRSDILWFVRHYDVAAVRQVANGQRFQLQVISNQGRDDAWMWVIRRVPPRETCPVVLAPKAYVGTARESNSTRLIIAIDGAFQVSNPTGNRAVMDLAARAYLLSDGLYDIQSKGKVRA